MLMAIGGGTGIALGEGFVPSLQREYDSRAWYQNNGLATLIAVAYYVALFMCMSHLRWQVQARSSVTYYACDGAAAMEGHDAVGFLSAFNQVPRQMLLQVIGHLPPDAPDATGTDAPAVEADERRIAFNFALDLSPWIVREEWSVVNCSTEGSDGTTSAQPLLAGIEAGELEQLQAFLESDANDLASAVLHKHVVWPDWEDVATNIRQRIKQCGFPGTLEIYRESLESVKVQKNKSWAKFMTHRYMPVLCMLSIVGWPLYAMYMSWRCTELSVDSHFRVDIQAEDYWSLISDQLSASGFDATASSTGGSTS